MGHFPFYYFSCAQQASIFIIIYLFIRYIDIYSPTPVGLSSLAKK